MANGKVCCLQQNSVLLQTTGLARKGKKRYSEVERFKKKDGMGCHGI
jgi:hypothetical protein